METRWMIARLRRLVDLLEAEAIKSSEYADKDTSATRASVNDGRSLAYTRAAMLVKEILGDLVREATHLR